MVEGCDLLGLVGGGCGAKCEVLAGSSTCFTAASPHFVTRQHGTSLPQDFALQHLQLHLPPPSIQGSLPSI